jgi:very-short-patch-repair endonuclease
MVKIIPYDFIKDEIRQRRLEELGITVLRFTEAEVKYDMENVLRSIECIIIEVIKIKRPEKLPIGLKREV